MPTPDEDADDSTDLQPNRFDLDLDDGLLDRVTDGQVDDDLLDEVTTDDATDQLVEQVARQWGTPEGEWWP